MGRTAGWAAPVRSWRISLVLAIAAAAALLGAPAAQATDGGAHGYLPEKRDWCLGVSAPELTNVGTLHAFVRISYWDECVFPAKASIEIRSGDGGWREVGSEYTKHSDLKKKDWTTRTIRLSDLSNNTRYYIRSRIDYTGSNAHTSELTFRTGGDPARELRAQGSFEARVSDVGISLTAIIPDVGKNTPFASWQAPEGAGEFSAEEPWAEQGWTGKHPADCRPFTENYSKCTWRFIWRVSIGVPRPVPHFMWRDGLPYRVRLCVKNSVYENEFGSQCTKEFTVTAGKAGTVDVGQG